MTEPTRPNPELLLERYGFAMRREEHGRGRLRVFLGAAPGVGKTYAMLCDGHRLKAAGRDIVAGLIETHGRAARRSLAAPPRQRRDPSGRGAA